MKNCEGEINANLQFASSSASFHLQASNNIRNDQGYHCKQFSLSFFFIKKVYQHKRDIDQLSQMM